MRNVRHILLKTIHQRKLKYCQKEKLFIEIESNIKPCIKLIETDDLHFIRNNRTFKIFSTTTITRSLRIFKKVLQWKHNSE